MAANIRERETSRVGKRGTVVIPAPLRRQFGLEEGSLVITERTEDGILIRPAVSLPVEIYTPERIAEFLLNNAVSERDYEAARRKVTGLGINPDSIPHDRP